MEWIYFEQEVLARYERTSGFDVLDDGSVMCQPYWGLNRSTVRIGNELLATTIGDFAEAVPFEEWPHWKQYSVEPPSRETAKALGAETTVPNAVNSLFEALHRLNIAFASLADSLNATVPAPLWRGSRDSFAGRRLKWTYPDAAEDDEFLERATLVSTLVFEDLVPGSLRSLLKALGPDLHLNDSQSRQRLAPRNLLQRVALIAILIVDFKPDISEIPTLVKQAEGKVAGVANGDPELASAYHRVRGVIAPLAFLYDLRTFGGLAHAPNTKETARAAAQLGLPQTNWHRGDYLRLLSLVTGSIMQISKDIEAATLEDGHG